MQAVTQNSTKVSSKSRTATYASLVIPVYNAEQWIALTLEKALSYLQAQDYSFEVIVVDDGSTDQTGAILDAYRDKVCVLRNPRNMGKGFSVRRGILASNGKYVVFTDADLPFTLEPMAQFIEYLETHDFDLVIGARDRRDFENLSNLPWIRRIASLIFTAFASKIVVTGIPDTQCGFKAFKRNISQSLFSRSRIDRFAFDVEVIYLARTENFAIKRVPLRLAGSRSSSSVRLFSDSLNMLVDVFRIKWNYMRGLYR